MTETNLYKILILEDNEYDAQLVIHTLRDVAFNYETRICNSRKEYLRALHDFEPDIILADFNLPSINGFEALKLSAQSGKEVEFIIISGVLGEEKVVELMKAGVSDVIAKHNLSQLPVRLLGSLNELAVKRERKAAVDELSKNHDFLEKINTSTPFIIYIFDVLKQELAYANRAIFEATGYTEKELKSFGSGLYQKVIFPEDIQLYFDAVAHYSKMKDGEKHVTEHRLIAKSGSILNQRNTAVVFSRNEKGEVEQVIGTIEDITDIKQANRLLKESEEHYRSLIENSSDIVSIFKLDGEIIYLSPNIKGVLGFDPDQLKGTNVLALLPPEKKEEAASKLNSIINEPGNISTVEYRITGADGQNRYIESKVLVTVANERPDRIIANSRDITDRKKVENAVHYLAALVPSDSGGEFFSMLVKNLAQSLDFMCCFVGLIDEDNENQIKTLAVYSDGKLMENFNYGLAGTPCNIVLGNEICAFREHVTDLFPKDTMLQDMGAESYIGTPLWNTKGESIGIMALIDSKPMHDEALVKDMFQLYSARATHELERIESVQLALQNEEFVSRIINSLESNLAVMDLNGKIIMVNEAWRNFAKQNSVGSIQQASVGQNYLEVCKKSFENGDESAGAILAGIKEVLEQKSESFRYEYPCHSPEEQRWFILRVTPHGVGNKGVVIAHTNITERKLAELELQNMASELIQSNTELEQFAYIASHDLRAPVINLNSLLSLIDKSKIQEGQNRDIFEKSEYVAGQLNNILKAMIEKVSQKKTKEHVITQISFAEVTEEVSKIIEDQIIKSGAVVQVDFSRAKKIRYDKQHLISFIQNLLSNAIKYKHPDRDPEINISTKKENGFIRLAVSDNGIGIDLNEHGEKIFKMFQRFHPGQEGKGLGLYLVKAQLESLGGRIEVVSKPDQGTEFALYLKNNPERTN